MKKKVVIVGSTGMVGGIVLQLCLQHQDVIEVTALVRKSTNIQHEKYKEIVVSDFLNYDMYTHLFNNTSIVYYCLGVYTGSVPSDEFRKINVDYPYQLAISIHSLAPNATFCLLSGQGADTTEKSSMQFARDKGTIENTLSAGDLSPNLQLKVYLPNGLDTVKAPVYVDMYFVSSDTTNDISVYSASYTFYKQGRYNNIDFVDCFMYCDVQCPLTLQKSKPFQFKVQLI